MFSIITIASSTTNPVEIVSAIIVKLFRLYPARYITPSVPISDSGIATNGITVAHKLRRNRKITMMTSPITSTAQTQRRSPTRECPSSGP